MARWNRTRWTPAQREVLERAFDDTPFPTRATRQELASALGVTTRSVQVWFQNQRQRRLAPPPPLAAVMETASEIRLLASIVTDDDPCDIEHVSSISAIVGADPHYVHRVIEGSRRGVFF